VKLFLYQTFSTAINNSITKNFHELLSSEQARISKYEATAKKFKDDFDQKAANPKFPQCSGFKNNATEIYNNFNVDLQLSVDSIINSVARAGRYMVNSFTLYFGRKFVEDVNNRYLQCLGKCDVYLVPNGTCKVLVRIQKISTENFQN
jgi:hypothetical protein